MGQYRVVVSFGIPGQGETCRGQVLENPSGLDHLLTVGYVEEVVPEPEPPPVPEPKPEGLKAKAAPPVPTGGAMEPPPPEGAPKEGG